MFYSKNAINNKVFYELDKWNSLTKHGDEKEDELLKLVIKEFVSTKIHIYVSKME